MFLKICLAIALTAVVRGTLIENFDKHFTREVVISEDNGANVTQGARCDPGILSTVLVTAFTHIVIVEWTAPTSCVSGFIVSLDGEQEVQIAYNNLVQWYMHAYQNVEACTVFNVQITVVGEDGTLGEPTNRNIQTLSPLDPPDRISNITYGFLENSWTVSWNPPLLEGNCITSYDIYLWNDLFSTSIQTPIPFYEFSPYTPCSFYGTRIIAMMGSLSSYQTSSFVVLTPRALRPPTPLRVSFDDYITNLYFSLESFSSNWCEVRYVTAQCTMNATLTFSFDQYYDDSRERPEAEIRIPYLPSNTDYSCRASVTISSGDTSDLSEPITFRLY